MEETFYAPLLVLVGQADTVTPARYCEEMKPRQPPAAPELTLVVYPWAPHTVDMPLPDRRVLGMRLGFDPDALADARRHVATFLSAHGVMRATQSSSPRRASAPGTRPLGVGSRSARDHRARFEAILTADGIVGAVQAPTAPAGRVVAVRTAGGSTEHTTAASLERGPLTVLLVIRGLPIDELPVGTRLRLGTTALIELTTTTSGDRAGIDPDVWKPGLLEAGTGSVTAASVREVGSVGPGDEVWIEAVSVPLTDVLDLHSFRPEETQQVVTAYLDEARRARLGEVRIIHGRGRGVQRAAIRRVLADAPGVAEFSDAPPTRGGWGATIVRLRPVEDVPAE